MDKREVLFELGCGIEATLVYYVVKHDMSFLLDDNSFRSYMQELAEDDFENY